MATVLDRINKLCASRTAARAARSHFTALDRRARMAQILGQHDAGQLNMSVSRRVRLVEILTAARARMEAARSSASLADQVASPAAPDRIDAAPADGIQPTLPRSTEFIAQRESKRALREQLERIASKAEHEAFHRLTND
jgi:hypothetical protein